MNSPIHKEDLLHTDDENPRAIREGGNTARFGPSSVESAVEVDMDEGKGSLFYSHSQNIFESFMGASPHRSNNSSGRASPRVLLGGRSPDLSLLHCLTPSTTQHSVSSANAKAAGSESGSALPGLNEDMQLFTMDLLSDFTDSDGEQSPFRFSDGLRQGLDGRHPSEASRGSGDKSGFMKEFSRFLTGSSEPTREKTDCATPAKRRFSRKRKRPRATSEATIGKEANVASDGQALPVLKLRRMSAGNYAACLAPSSPNPSLPSPKPPRLKIKYGSPEVSGERQEVSVTYQDPPNLSDDDGAFALPTENAGSLSPPVLQQEPHYEGDSFNVQQYLAWQVRAGRLRRKVLRLCRLLFPRVPLPRSKDCPQVSCLIDQIIHAARGEAVPAGRLRSLSAGEVSFSAARVLVCASPQACLAHLRRKIVGFLKAVLPGLPLDATHLCEQGDVVDELLQRVYAANKQRLKREADVT